LQISPIKTANAKNSYAKLTYKQIFKTRIPKRQQTKKRKTTTKNQKQTPPTNNTTQKQIQFYIQP